MLFMPKPAYMPDATAKFLPIMLRLQLCFDTDLMPHPAWSRIINSAQQQTVYTVPQQQYTSPMVAIMMQLCLCCS